MRLEDIPIVPGPGSQPESPDGAQLDFPEMPADMATFQPPDLSEWYGRLEDHPAAEGMLDIIAGACADETRRPVRLSLGGLAAGDRALLDDLLGEGEVSIRLDGGHPAAIQESVLTGVWRERIFGADGEAAEEAVTVASVPPTVAEAMVAGTRPGLPEVDTRGTQNAPAVLAELDEHLSAYRPGEEAHVVNLTLLPLDPPDMAALERLGAGPVAILSRGYGNCRINATGVRNLWRVQYFNSTDTLILDTLEVVDVPAVARAAEEDLADSAYRLAEIRESLR
jgi:hydrogenase-1 operon protein HyaF